MHHEPEEDDKEIAKVNHACIKEPEARAYHRQGLLYPAIAESLTGCPDCEAICEKVRKEFI